MARNNDNNRPLAANVSFVGKNVDLTNYAEISATIFSDQTGTLYIEQSANGDNWDVQESLTYNTTNQSRTLRSLVSSTFGRVRYVNGGTNQTTCRLKTLFLNKPTVSLIDHPALPDSVGQRPVNDSLSVTLAEEHATIPVTIANEASAAANCLVHGWGLDTNQPQRINSNDSRLSVFSTQLPESVGQNAMAQSLSVAVASDQVVPVSLDTLPLPAGAALETTLSSLNSKVTACDTGAVVVRSSVLPTGGATENTLAAAETHLGAIETSLSDVATQTTLSSLDSKVTACDTGNVTIAASALPTGAGTEATLLDIRNRLPTSLGQQTAANSLAVVNPVKGSFRNSNVSTTGLNAYSGPGTVHSVVATNSGANPAYLKLYDESVTPTHNNTPRMVAILPAGQTTAITGLELRCNNRIQLRATTGIADNDTGAPGANEVNVTLTFTANM